MDPLKSILCRAFRVRAEDLPDEASMEDVPGWDSLSHMDLIVALEEQFQVQFTGDEIAEMRSLGAIRDVLDHRAVLDGHPR